MLKHELRKKYLRLRKEFSNSYISNASLTIANHALKIPIWDFFYFHIFLSIEENKEVDTLPLITLLQGRDKNVVVPKVDGPHSMVNFLLTDNTVLKKNNWNIPEPMDGIPVPENKIDVVFVPLLAVDGNGHRVGYGKGYYDTFLGKCRKNVVKVGLSLFEPMNDSISDTHENDVALDYCITPDMVHQF
ncbi:5-formyltetrahydrofolate cyclo-ligase [Muricauda sp. JGD-17]|uniref:5-formyltetrahydrofolate cyclo-ligase n=1 Tax=Flagellimonas ochracea TaxID=2696472 RepID=A0A964TBN9_9FLAO|nr:5-formyltetrahydrofolate cyclo-ligase [Allomuricauda ochracea]NAY91892.1 5-formyltetrahydrofolate cyclo-ligase [Allomuricauda ochracea]